MSKPGYRPDIDGLRAVAVLAVLFYHADLGFPGGFVGVDVFFVISGYLITRLIIADVDRGTFTFRNFWIRRLRRIWPAASVMALATLAVGFVLLGPAAYHQLATDAIPQALMLANVHFMQSADYFGISTDRRALLHTWSLAVEEQFYLFYPFLIVFVLRSRKNLLAPTLLLLALGSLLLSILALDKHPGGTFYLLPTRAWELLIGALLCTIPTSPFNRFWTFVVGTIGAVLVLVPIFMYTKATAFPGITAIPPCIGTALLIYTGTSKHSVYAKMLAFEPMRRIGLISYSLYLVHWPILAFMREYNWPAEPLLSWRLTAIALSFILAYLSWRFVEQRFRHGHAAPKFMRVVLISASVSALVVSIGFVIRETDGARGRFDQKLLLHIEPESVPDMWNTTEVDLENFTDFMKPIGYDSPAHPSFVLWGDSHASAISQLVDDEAKRLELNGIARIVGGISPVPNIWSLWFNEDQANANQNMLNWILANDIKNVILNARWSVLTNGATTGTMAARNRSLVRPVGDKTEVTPRTAQQLLENRLSLLINTLEEANITVWILIEVPLQHDSPQQRGIKSWLTGEEIPLRGVSEDEHRVHIKDAMTAVKNAATPKTRIIDLATPFFDENGLSIIAAPDGTSYYSDDDHVNNIGAQALLKPLFREMFNDIAQSTTISD